MSKKSSKIVPIQKGAINSNPTTMKQMTYPERVAERKEEFRNLRKCQTLDLHTPTKGKK